jgi:hypothetical protein
MKPIKYKYSREEIQLDIKLSPQTQDGVYWCPKVMEKLRETTNEKGRGYDDKEYTINRCYFHNKPFYTQKDLHYLQNTVFNQLVFNYDLFRFLNLKFFNENKDIIWIEDLDKRIGENRLKDIVDMFLILNNYYLI